MKKFALSLMVLAIVAVCATSQAALISLYGFEEGTGTIAANSVAGQQAGTLGGAATWAAGIIGDGAYSNPTDTAGYVDITGSSVMACDAFATNAGGFWSGSWSMWVNRPLTTAVPEPTVFVVDYEQGWRASWLQYDTYFKVDNIRIGGTYYLRNGMTGVSADPPLDFYDATVDGDWHLLTYTYEITTGAAGTGTGTMYVDGVALTTGTYAENVITSDWTQGAKVDHYLFDWGTTSTSEVWNGSVDDMANWNEILNANEAAALYNLGKDETLNYGADKATALFDLYAGNVGDQAMVGGQLWQKVGTGLGSVGGAVIGSAAVNLGGEDGSGVQIVPEPGTLALLGAGLIGLLVFAWRKRK